MRHLMRTALAVLCGATLLSVAAAQPPAKPADDARDKAKDYSNAPLVVKMMAFDKKKDGKLTRDEITDERLLRVFDEADANKDGVVTKDELMALAAKLDADAPRGDRNGPPRGDRDNPPPPRGDRQPPGPGDRPPGDRDGPPGGPPRPGMVLPPFAVDALKLTDDQKKQLDELQKDVDAKLDKLLTADQKQQLKDLRPPRGPGRDGPPGPGRDGPPGPGDRPPPGRDNPPPRPGQDR